MRNAKKTTHTHTHVDVYINEIKSVCVYLQRENLIKASAVFHRKSVIARERDVTQFGALVVLQTCMRFVVLIKYVDGNAQERSRMRFLYRF